MSNILFIVGLPGSGKTRLARKINRDSNGKYVIINDPKDFSKDVEPFLNDDIIITDPNLCFEKNRINAIKKIKSLNSEAKIDWIFFENDPTNCLINSDIRNRANSISLKPVRKVESFIKNLSKYYTIPENSNIVSVYNSNG